MSTKTNTINITVTTTFGSEERTRTQPIEGETRRHAMDACKQYMRTFSSKLEADGWSVVPTTKIDFSATKTIATPSGDAPMNVLFEARWETRRNKLVTSIEEGFRSSTVGIKPRSEKSEESETEHAKRTVNELVTA